MRIPVIAVCLQITMTLDRIEKVVNLNFITALKSGITIWSSFIRKQFEKYFKNGYHNYAEIFFFLNT